MKDKDIFIDQAQALLVQKHQLDRAEGQLGRLDGALSVMLAQQAENHQRLDLLLVQTEAFVSENLVVFDVDEEDSLLVESSFYIQSSEVEAQPTIETIDHIDLAEGLDWQGYVDHVSVYAARHQIDFEQDPFHALMSTSQRIALEKRIKDEFSLKGANCDKYDYMIAGTCGLIGGLVDILFVGAPGNSSLGDTTKDYADKATDKFASLMGFKKEEAKNNYFNNYLKRKSSAGEPPLPLENYIAQKRVQFLEGKFKINYDQTSTGGRKNGTGGKVKNLSPSNHHLKSLGHSPDIVGLFFSILNQFTNTSSFISDGKIITIDTEKFELQGGNFTAKVFCGFVNWFGHIMSDLAGSNSSIAKGNSGMGVPIPFFSLLQFADFGDFGKHRQTFAKISTQVFEQGYDFRHGMAMAIPVLLTELLTRITWVIKQHFYHKKPWSECMPSASNPELRRMLLIAHGSLCLVDTADAAIRSCGDMMQFMLRSNIIAWARLGTVALKELAAWHKNGDLDFDAIDTYLDIEYKRLLSK